MALSAPRLEVQSGNAAPVNRNFATAQINMADGGLSPGSPLRVAYDINSPKQPKPTSRWAQAESQGDVPQASALPRTESGFGTQSRGDGSDDRLHTTQGATQVRTVTAAGVSTRHIDENEGLKPVTVDESGSGSNIGGRGTPGDGTPTLPTGKSRSGRNSATDGGQGGPAPGPAALGSGPPGGPGHAFKPVVKSPGGAGAPPVTPARSSGPGAADGEPPAALAALLHQTDRSGKQQKAVPHTPSSPVPYPSSYPSSPGVGATGSSGLAQPANGAAGGKAAPKRTGMAALFSCCFTPSAVESEVPGPAPGQQGRPGASLASSASTDLGSSEPAPVAQHTEGSDAVGAPTAGQSGSGTRQPVSPSTAKLGRKASAGEDNRDGGSAGQRNAGQANGGQGGAGGSAPASSGQALTTPVMPRLQSRRSGSADGFSQGGDGTVPAAPMTPSALLSPTSIMARTSREEWDGYAKQGTPAWGSKHPTVIHAHYETQRMMQPGMGRLFNGRGGVAIRGRGAGQGYATGQGPSMQMSPVQAMEKEVEALYTPSKARRVMYGPPPTDERPPCPHPRQRINNVRRPNSMVGDGPLLAPLMDIDKGKHCLVLDLDETLVHSSFKPVPNADYVLPVEIEGTVHYVYVCKRPGCEEFLAAVGERYEVVLFTASLAKYADPLLDLLDPYNVIRARLFREACVFYEGSYVKDMSLLGRSPASTIIVDNSPASYLFQPENALPCDSFIDDMSDTELWSLADFLNRVADVADVRQALQQWTSGAWAGGHDLPYVHPPLSMGALPDESGGQLLGEPDQPAEGQAMQVRRSNSVREGQENRRSSGSKHGQGSGGVSDIPDGVTVRTPSRGSAGMYAPRYAAPQDSASQGVVANTPQAALLKKRSSSRRVGE